MTASITEPVVVFLAFANDRVDPDRHLRSLADEQRQVRAALEAAEQDGYCKIVECVGASITDIFDVFLEYPNRIAVFHFGGHAGDAELFFESREGESEVAQAAGLARFLHEQRGLELVFLNGCSSRGQAQGLLDAGVSAVLATSRAIDDARATEFSVWFYKSLASGGPIGACYRRAAAAVDTRHGSSTRGRDDLYPSKTPSHGLPWNLYHPPGAEERLERWSLPAAARDWLFGLPRPTERDLPVRPFKHLEWFTAADAEIFFGRGKKIRELYEAVSLEDTSPVVLLFGATGVGKSSLLAAGLLPRLEIGHAVEYVRRDGTVGLAGALSEVLGAGEDLGAAWRRREEELGKPLVVILDQAEEAWTRPLPEGDEGGELAAALGQVFAVPDERPRGRLILSFRKEWLAEVLDLLESARLPRPRRVELEHLDRDGIMEAVAGVARTPRLRREYGLRVADELPGIVADDLLADQEGTIAPALQILLTKMWDRACAADAAAPAFTVELYQDLGGRGDLLDDFLEEQLAAIRQWRPGVVDSGLALDLLAHHTTPLGTAEVHQAADVIARYGGGTEIVELLQQCKDRFLLAGTFRTQRGCLLCDEPSATVPEPPSGAVRLAHDTLARLIRSRFDASDLPGQRALRVLEQRAVDWAHGKEGPPLADVDLAIVERGERGMRARNDDQERLVAASRHHRDHRRRKRRRRKGLWAGAAAVIVLFAGLALLRTLEARRSAREAFEAKARERDRARVAVAANTEDPTDRTLVLLEITDPAQTPFALRRLLETASLPVHFAPLEGHTEGKGVFSASFSRDGTRVVTVSYDGNAQVWDAESGSRLSILERHEEAVLSASISPDGTRVVTGFSDGTVRLWDADSASFEPLEGHIAAVTSASFSPDGTRVVTASFDKTARVWDTRSRASRPLKEHDRLRSASFDPEGTRVVTASLDGTAVVWDAESGAKRLTLGKRGSALWSASFSPNGTRVVTASEDGTVQLWDAESSKPSLKTFEHEEAVLSASFNHDGTRIVTASRDTTAKVWDAETDARPVIHEGHDSTVLSASFSPDGKRVLTASLDGKVHLWDANSGASIATLEAGAESAFFASFSPDGRRVVTGFSDGTALLWSVELDASLATLEGLFGGVRFASFNPNGTRVVAASRDGTAQVWNAESGAKLLPFQPDDIAVNASPFIPTVVTAASFGPNGTRVVTGSSDGTTRVWDAKSGKRLVTLAEHGGAVTSASFSPEGTRVVTASSDGTAVVWDAESGARRLTLGRRGSAFWSASFSPNGTRVLTASEDGTVQLWDAESDLEQEPLDFEKHSRAVWSASFSPDGKRVVTASFDGETWVSDAESGLKLLTLENYEEAILSASFSPDGRRLLTASGDAIARLWDAESGAKLATIEGDTNAIPLFFASFSKDGTRVITAWEGGTARVWALDKLLQSLLRSRIRTCLDVEFRRSRLRETADEACRNRAACEVCAETFFESPGSQKNADVASRLSAWDDYQSCLERERESDCATPDPPLDTSVTE